MNVAALFEPRNRRISDIEDELMRWRLLALVAVTLSLVMFGVLVGVVYERDQESRYERLHP